MKDWIPPNHLIIKREGLDEGDIKDFIAQKGKKLKEEMRVEEARRIIESCMSERKVI